jgi:protein-L-isoaspartate O-methyltransferase
MFLLHIQSRQDMAHTDQPLKEGNIHISAPHIYGTVLEALELPPQSSASFLNLGSGTGYLSCIAAEILGPHGHVVAVELHPDVLEHAAASQQVWLEHRVQDLGVAPLTALQGNALYIETNQGEARLGFDRIYIGAAVDTAGLVRMCELLRPGGILVGPGE